MSVSDLVSAVERAFEETGRGLAPWPDPHPDRQPTDEEYSRVTDAAKWRIVGARADAWLRVLEELHLADIDRDTTVHWVDEHRAQATRVDRAAPTRPGSLPLVIARTAFGGVDDAGVLVGVGDPSVLIERLPDCGCDACDSGSQNELDQVDRVILGIVSGTFRRLTSGSRQITQLDRQGWSASGDFARGEVPAVLADATGWQELSGASWADVD